MKVLICGSSRLESQANAQVRHSVMNGWCELVGDENVSAANISGAAAVITEMRPDIVVGLGSYLPESTYFGEVARQAKRAGAAMVYWATEDPYEQDASYRIESDFDIVFCCDRWGVNFYTHKHAYHLPLAADARLHYVPVQPGSPRPIDVLFCGVAFSSRKEIVEAIRPSLTGLNISFIGPGWGQFGAGFTDRRIEKDQLIQAYGRSKIVLNLGRSLHFENRRHQIAPSSPGPRTFEVALAGTMQLFHEDTYEIRRYFTRSELPSFSNPVEFDELLQHYLSSPGQRDQVAIAAQRRALAEHTYAHRAQTVVDTLKSQGFL